MAPNKVLKTYSKGNNSNISCIQAMNILFAKNLTERKIHNKIRKGKSKIQIKELPKKIRSVLSDESSLHVNINDTFDKLLKAPRNSIGATVKITAKNNSTTTTKHYSKCNSFSPILSKLRSSKNKNESSEASSYSWFKQPTLPGERITNELEIEEIKNTNKKSYQRKKSFSKQDSSREPILLRSRVKFPDILVTDASSIKNDGEDSKSIKESNKSVKKNTESSILDPSMSYNPIFTNSVREKILMHSSTPLVSNKITRLVKQPISPIKTVNDEVNDVDNEINKSIIESFEEIDSWDEKFPSKNSPNNKNDNPPKRENNAFEKQEGGFGSQKADSFVTIRGRKVNRSTIGSQKHDTDSNKTKSFNLEEFELFYNKFKTRSFKLEDFERFQNSFSQQLSDKLGQNQVNKSNTISLKDFESFYTAYQNKISMKGGSFLVKSHRTINYVTNRKHRLSLSKKSINLSQKYLKLSKEFDLKNLVVVLDNILVKNSTEKIKKSKSLCQTALMNSVIRKQPVVNLTRLSIKNAKLPTFKAKNRLSLNGYTACRKFSSNYTPRRNSYSTIDSLPCSDIFELGQLFINITRMPLNVDKSSPKIKEVVNDISVNGRKGRISEKGPNRLKTSEQSKEDRKNDSASEKENKKSKNRKSSTKDGENEKSCCVKNNFSSPEHKSFKLSDNNPKESLSSSQKVKKSMVSDSPDRNRKSKLVEHDKILSEKTGIQMLLLSDTLTAAINRKSNSNKKYIAKILVGSISDTELEVRNPRHSLLRAISKNLAHSQENISGHYDFPDDSLKKRKSFKKSTRVFRSCNNISLNSTLMPEKTDKFFHKPSHEEVTHEVNSRISRSHLSNSNAYKVHDFSQSILLNSPDISVAVPKTPIVRDIVVNLTLDKSLGAKTDTPNHMLETKKEKKNLNKEKNSSTDNSKHKTSHHDLNSSISKLDISLNKTPRKPERFPVKKSLCFDIQNSVRSTRSQSALIESSIASPDFIDSSIASSHDACFKAPLALGKWKQRIPNLKAGKSFRRSLLVHKRESMIDLTLDLKNAGPSITRPSTSSARQGSLMPQNLSQARRQSIKIVPLCDPRLSRRKTALQTYAQSNLSIVADESIVDLTTPIKSRLTFDKSLPLITAKDIVFKRCGQAEPEPFKKLYPKSLLKDCKKIGEGVYGEVFIYTNPSGNTTVMKVIPIEGNKMVNQERQKKFDEILSEIIIASELSKLRKSNTNQTSAFSEVQRICCVKGKYPKILLDLWEAFDDAKGSENDHPEIFGDDQLYIVLDLANAGSDLEAFVFNNALQATSMFKQVACALAVAEQQLQFEHRDLHWGNVLLKSVDKNKKVTCKHKGKIIESRTQGVEVTIIDFTLSRIVHDGVVIFNDLGQDPDLFVAEGDYQFDIYRLMRDKNSNNWQPFEPYTNVLWLHYILKKSITSLRYKNIKTKLHKKNIDCLKDYEKVILKFNSVSEFVSQYY